jgi:hypothetical protein
MRLFQLSGILNCYGTLCYSALNTNYYQRENFTKVSKIQNKTLCLLILSDAGLYILNILGMKITSS